MIKRSHQYLAGPGLGPLLIKATVGSAGLRIAGMFLGFLVGVQLARGLGAEGYGIYGLAMSILTLLTVPTESGLPQLLMREVAAAQADSDWGRLAGILRWSTNVVLLLAAGAMIVVTILLIASGRDLGSPLALTLMAGLVMIPLVALGKLRSAALLGLQHIVKGQIPDIVLRPALYACLLLVASWLTVPLQPSLAMGLGAGSAGCSLALAAAMLRNNLPPEVGFASPRIQSSAWWACALPMALTEGMRALQGHLAILLLGIMTTVSIVGVFRVAVSVALLVAAPVTLLNVVSAPIIARLHAQGDRDRSQRLLSWIALGMTCSTLALTLPLMVAGAPLLTFVFGDQFVDANAPLLVLCGSALINGFFGTNATLLNMTGHHARVTRASAVSLALLALDAPLSIMSHGAIGAAIAIALSMLVWNVLMWRDARRLLALDTSFVPFLTSPKFHV